ncbi:hypothetical protein [Fischerella sp. JS2]|nr:hypothetical protein [Fischerella sp. JS2]
MINPHSAGYTNSQNDRYTSSRGWENVAIAVDKAMSHKSIVATYLKMVG